MPAARASSSLATTPMPTTARSVSTGLPSSSRTAPASQPTIVRARRRSMPAARCSSSMNCDSVTGTTRAITRACASTTVTATPSVRAVAASSSPITPAPTSRSRRPGCSNSRRRRASCSVRRVSSGQPRPSSIGKVRGRVPVASTSVPQDRRSPSASRRLRSTTLTDSARRPRSQRTSVARLSVKADAHGVAIDEEGLGQRRAVVRRLVFIADDGQFARVPALAQGRRERQRRQSAADHQHWACAIAAHASAPRPWMIFSASWMCCAISWSARSASRARAASKILRCSSCTLAGTGVVIAERRR